VGEGEAFDDPVWQLEVMLEERRSRVGDVGGPTTTKETARETRKRDEIREKVPSMTAGVFAEKLASIWHGRILGMWIRGYQSGSWGNFNLRVLAEYCRITEIVQPPRLMPILISSAEELLS
jgi:hypothetical protein